MKKIFPLVLGIIVLTCGCSANNTSSADISNSSEQENVASEDIQKEIPSEATDEPSEITVEDESIKTDEFSEEEWKAKYLEFLKGNVSDNLEDQYGFVFVDDDDVPEMAIDRKDKGYCYLTCGPDGCDSLDIENIDSSTEVYFHEKENCLEILNHDYSANTVSYKLYKIDNGKWSSVNSGDNEPTEEDFAIKGSSGFYRGSTYEQMCAYLSGNGPKDYRTAFQELVDTSHFTEYSGKKYDEYALYDLGNDGTMELIGISKDDIFDSYSYGIASYKDGLVAVVEQGGSDEMTDSTIFDIDLSTISRTSVFPRFSSYFFETVKNCTMVKNYYIEGDLTSAPAGDEEDEGWSYDPEVDGEYMYNINGIYRGESYVSEILIDWKSNHSGNRKYITFLSINDKYSPDPCEKMEFSDLDSALASK